MSVLKGKTWQLLHGASWNVGAYKKLPTSLYLLCSDRFCFIIDQIMNTNVLVSPICAFYRWHTWMVGGIYFTIVGMMWGAWKGSSHQLNSVTPHPWYDGWGWSNGKFARHVFGEVIFLSPQCSNLNFKYEA